MAVEFIVDEDVDASAVPDEARVRKACAAAVQAAGHAPEGLQLCLRIADDAVVHALNRRWRGQDKVTDVLAFAMQEGPGFDFSDPLGDIILAWPFVQRESGRLGLSPAEHALHLIVHGVLHLLGHDHQRHEDTRKMRACERRAMRLIGLHDPYPQEEGAHA